MKEHIGKIVTAIALVVVFVLIGWSAREVAAPVAQLDVLKAAAPLSTCVAPLPKEADPFDSKVVNRQYSQCYWAVQRYNAVSHSLHQQNELDHRRRTFEWSLLTSRYLFALVALITVSGIGMAWIAVAQGQKGESSFKFTREGLEMKSPFIGLMLLGLSLGFLYLYASLVFPVGEIESTQAAQVRQDSALADEGDSKSSDKDTEDSKDE